ncbi:Leucine-rich repeat [Macleaya cordata]|uniref:non-specific serine/threonine protein kinase n=1 Tax=Macleaya cordata TaxID=56857 RepID=A0A200Q942_MACCD|nr:Leucine-rich repeat [Macleaya cordata]
MRRNDMELLFFCCLLVLLLMFSESVSPSLQQQFLSNDMVSLLAFERSSIQTDPHGFLTNWTPATTTNNLSSTPCSWNGVICSTDGQVTALNLTNAGLIGNLHIDNIKSLENLRHLYLGGNSFSGDLSHNITLPCKFETIDLSSNNFSTPISQFFLPYCNRLISLNLSGNSISGGDFTFGPSLQVIDLSSNNISDYDILNYALSNCPNLKHLNFSNNNLYGRLNTSISSCKNLLTLDLSNNLLYGNIPANFVAAGLETQVSSLKFLDLSYNNFSGKFSDLSLGSCGNLTVLNLSFNSITGFVPLSLTNCGQLQVLDLSSNGFTGNLPSGFCSSPFNCSLQKVLLPGNFLSGPVPSELGNCKNLKTIDLSFNNLSGSIPMEIWTLPNLTNLIIWANNLSGEIPENICSNGGNLETLILNNNFITGNIPSSLANCNNLVWVSLHSNRLTGKIPTSIGNLQKLVILQLGNNSLTGEIPPELGKCRGLIWLDLNSNGFTGSIPPELAEQSGFISPSFGFDYEMGFFRNEGDIDCGGVVGLFRFEGIRLKRIADFLTCPSIRIYRGLTIYSFPNNGSMILLDLSYNSLTGKIPESFGTMNYLQVLNLGHNRLTGTIPYSFGGLKQVGILDLSHNELEGSLPISLGMLSYLSDFDVSNNHLTGSIPSSGQMVTFPASRFENNSGLCDDPLPPCMSDMGTTSQTSFSLPEKKNPFDDVEFLVSIELGLIVGKALLSVPEEEIAGLKDYMGEAPS